MVQTVEWCEPGLLVSWSWLAGEAETRWLFTGVKEGDSLK